MTKTDAKQGLIAYWYWKCVDCGLTVRAPVAPSDPGHRHPVCDHAYNYDKLSEFHGPTHPMRPVLSEELPANTPGLYPFTVDYEEWKTEQQVSPEEPHPAAKQPFVPVDLPAEQGWKMNIIYPFTIDEDRRKRLAKIVSDACDQETSRLTADQPLTGVAVQLLEEYERSLPLITHFPKSWICYGTDPNKPQDYIFMAPCGHGGNAIFPSWSYQPSCSSCRNWVINHAHYALIDVPACVRDYTLSLKGGEKRLRGSVPEQKGAVPHAGEQY